MWEHVHVHVDFNKKKLQIIQRHKFILLNIKSDDDLTKEVIIKPKYIQPSNNFESSTTFYYFLHNILHRILF